MLFWPLVEVALGATCSTGVLYAALPLGLSTSQADPTAPQQLGSRQGASLRGPARLALHAGLLAAAVVGAGVATAWPVAAVALALPVLVATLSVRRPAIGFLAAVSLTAFEGILKARFTIEGVPSHDAAVAGLVELLLVGTALRLLWVDRGRSLLTLWRRAGRAEHVMWLLIAGWLALSVLQIPESGHLGQGIRGFRLVQAYLFLILPGVAVLAVGPGRDVLIRFSLLTFGVVAAYATLRATIGPASWELSYSSSRTQQTLLGSVVRDIGSFASPQELASFLAPAGVFAAIIGALDRRVRVLAWVVFGLSLDAVIESYVRVGLVALGVGIAVLAVLTALQSAASIRTRIVAIAGVFALAAGAYSLALVAGNVSKVAASRASGLSHPLTDASIQTRLHRWDHALAVTLHHPLGTGIGTSGNATQNRYQTTNYTDNSYLQVLEEQGVVGLLYVAGVFGTAYLLARRLVRAGTRRDPLAVAALGGFLAFLTVCFLGEYFELPGKALAWTMLGMGLACAYGATGEDREPRSPVARSMAFRVWALPSLRTAARQSSERVRRSSLSERATVMAAIAVLAGLPLLVSASQSSGTVLVGLTAPSGSPPLTAATAVRVEAMVGQQLRNLQLGQQFDPQVILLSPQLRQWRPSTIRVVSSGTRSGELTVIASSTAPAAALQTLQLILNRIGTASGHDLAVWRHAHDVLLPLYRRLLTSRHLSVGARETVRAKERFVKAAYPGPAPVGVQVGPGAISRNGLWTRISARAPGTPRIPNPFWAAGTGLVLAVTLLLAGASASTTGLGRRRGPSPSEPRRR